jgi:hypothetical protein
MNMADFFTMTGREDRRWGLRKPTRIEAWADPGGTAPAVDCLIGNLSEGGARIASLTGLPLPDAFTLQVNETREIANVIWRTKEAVGVRFR